MSLSLPEDTTSSTTWNTHSSTFKSFVKKKRTTTVLDKIVCGFPTISTYHGLQSCFFPTEGIKMSTLVHIRRAVITICTSIVCH